MQELLTRVEEIVGFRPDGYVVTDLACFEELVDLMGDVTFDVPVEMHYNDRRRTSTSTFLPESRSWTARRQCRSCGSAPATRMRISAV